MIFTGYTFGITLWLQKGKVSKRRLCKMQAFTKKFGRKRRKKSKGRFYYVMYVIDQKINRTSSNLKSV